MISPQTAPSWVANTRLASVLVPTTSWDCLSGGVAAVGEPTLLVPRQLQRHLVLRMLRHPTSLQFHHLQAMSIFLATG